MANDRSTLEAAYLATTFRVEAPSGNVDIRIGRDSMKLDALLLHLGATEWAYVTAWNPGSRLLSADLNAAAQDTMLQIIRDRRFAFYEGDGIPDTPGWVPERSVWIAGISRQYAVKIGRQFGQNAIVVGILGGVAELVWLR
jgi:Protein of unknown function (DUF3293)